MVWKQTELHRNGMQIISPRSGPGGKNKPIAEEATSTERGEQNVKRTSTPNCRLIMQNGFDSS